MKAQGRMLGAHQRRMMAALAFLLAKFNRIHVEGHGPAEPWKYIRPISQRKRRQRNRRLAQFA